MSTVRNADPKDLALFVNQWQGLTERQQRLAQMLANPSLRSNWFPDGVEEELGTTVAGLVTDITAVHRQLKGWNTKLDAAFTEFVLRLLSLAEEGQSFAEALEDDLDDGVEACEDCGVEVFAGGLSGRNLCPACTKKSAQPYRAQVAYGCETLQEMAEKLAEKQVK